MIRSMTGFGAASAEAEGCRFAVEIKSVNNRFFKATVRVPEELSTLETEIESAVAKRLARGSIMVLVRFVPGGAVAAAEVNPAAARTALTALLAALPTELRDRATVDLGALLAVPGVLRTDGVDKIVEFARPVLVRLVDEACTRVLEMRAPKARESPANSRASARRSATLSRWSPNARRLQPTPIRSACGPA
jgi:uncharacterized protein (TIGR00255 family)